MIKIVLATSNPHKVKEMNEIARNSGIEFFLPPDNFNPDETGETFEQNALIKAKTASLLANSYALADDTGLCIDFLNGAPGLLSARYAPTQEEKIQRVLRELEGVEDSKRGAHFVCSMVLTDPKGIPVLKSEGKIYGHIIENPLGINGFGYDPIFFADEFQKTMAQMSDEEKNLHSHRARALLPLIEKIKEKLYY